jgi:hypothetical protein
VCGSIMNGRWLIFNFTDDCDVIFWWITHDGVEDVLSGYEFSTRIIYQTEGREEETLQVGYNGFCNVMLRQDDE